jgi:hypothetical protein
MNGKLWTPAEDAFLRGNGTHDKTGVASVRRPEVKSAAQT